MPDINPTTRVGPLTARIEAKTQDSTIQKPLRDETVDRPRVDAAPRVGFRAFEFSDADTRASRRTRLGTGKRPGPVVEAGRRTVDGASPSLSLTQLRQCRELVAVMRRVAVLRAEIAAIERGHAEAGAGCSPDPTKGQAELETRRAELETALCRAETIAVGIAAGVPSHETLAGTANRRGRVAAAAPRGSFLRRPSFRVAAACAIVLVSATPFVTGSVFWPAARGVSDQALPALLVSTVRASEQTGAPAEVASESHLTSFVSEGSGIVFYPAAKSAEAPPDGAMTASEVVSAAFEDKPAAGITPEDSAVSLESVDDET